jgi:hypothetical protein
MAKSLLYPKARSRNVQVRRKHISIETRLIKFDDQFCKVRMRWYVHLKLCMSTQNNRIPRCGSAARIFCSWKLSTLNTECFVDQSYQQRTGLKVVITIFASLGQKIAFSSPEMKPIIFYWFFRFETSFTHVQNLRETTSFTVMHLRSQRPLHVQGDAGHPG